MLRNRDIRKFQQILVMRRLYVYLLFLKYLNQLIKITDPQNNITTYTYDKNGNLTKKTEWLDSKQKIHTYTYDYENRLIKVEIQKYNRLKTVTFTYDPFGRRISKTVQREEIDDDDDDRDYIKTTYYVYDNEDIIMEYNQKGKITARYTHGLGIDEPLAIEQKGHVYYYHADGLGSIVALTDIKQKVVQTYDYDSFGNMKQHGDKVKQSYTFTAREWDRETGLYYYRARYYDAEAGRFLQKDTIGFADGMNAYLYAKANPIRYNDPFGLLSCDEVKKLVAANNLSGQSNEMIVCVCWKESSFNPIAMNTKDDSTAWGLMGMTVGAAKDGGVEYFQLGDPATSIKGGSKYLKLRIKWAGGNVTKGLEGYGTGGGYATNILSCEKCLKDNPCDCQKCLNLIHP